MGPCILPEPTPETLRACQVHTEQSAAQNWTGLWLQDQSQEGQDEVQTREPHTHPSPDVGGGSSSLQGAGCEPTGRLAHVSLAWPWRGDPCGWIVLTLSPCQPLCIAGTHILSLRVKLGLTFCPAAQSAASGPKCSPSSPWVLERGLPCQPNPLGLQLRPDARPLR